MNDPPENTIQGRVTNDHTDLVRVLAFDAQAIFFGDRAKQIAGHSARCCMRADIIQRVHETQIWEFLIFAGQRSVGGFDVQLRDVVREQRDFIGVQLVAVFRPQLGRLPAKVLQ